MFNYFFYEWSVLCKWGRFTKRENMAATSASRLHWLQQSTSFHTRSSMRAFQKKGGTLLGIFLLFYGKRASTLAFKAFSKRSDLRNALYLKECILRTRLHFLHSPPNTNKTWIQLQKKQTPKFGPKLTLNRKLLQLHYSFKRLLH